MPTSLCTVRWVTQIAPLQVIGSIGTSWTALGAVRALCACAALSISAIILGAIMLGGRQLCVVIIEFVSLYSLDLIGVFAFAVYGSYKALDKQFDVFGIFVSAALTALGGGAIRELLLHSYPAFMRDSTYALVVVAGVVFALLVYQRLRAHSRWLLFLDAIGLATFAFIGAQRADELGFGAGVMMFFAVLTAAGGGMLSDLVTGRVPQVFQTDFYATPAMLMALGYYWARPHVGSFLVSGGLIASVIGLRMLAIHWRVSLWRPHASDGQTRELVLRWWRRWGLAKSRLEDLIAKFRFGFGLH